MAHILILRAVRIVTLLLAGIMAYLAIKSYRRGGGRVMLALSIGFCLIALGALVSGLLFEFFNFTLEGSYIMESVLVATGLGVMIYSIYGIR